MTTFRRGAVCYVRFLFTNKVAAKHRPCVVVSSDDFHASRDDVIIAGVTSNLEQTHFVGHVELADWEQEGLRLPSAVSGILMTVRSSVLGDRVGSLSSSDLQLLDQALKGSLGLS